MADRRVSGSVTSGDPAAGEFPKPWDEALRPGAGQVSRMIHHHLLARTIPAFITMRCTPRGIDARSPSGMRSLHTMTRWETFSSR